ncbi:hypothetical protein VNO77_19606 [Canavalia gladiata]|uniref:Uncharacterized protein n=1 Tax=Canavalia gladiata TaxID=3824 RepID=A0AAN9LN33_CANGL
MGPIIALPVKFNVICRIKPGEYLHENSSNSVSPSWDSNLNNLPIPSTCSSSAKLIILILISRHFCAQEKSLTTLNIYPSSDHLTYSNILSTAVSSSSLLLWINLGESEPATTLEIMNQNLGCGDASRARKQKKQKNEGGHSTKEMTENKRNLSMCIEEGDVRDRAGWVSRILTNPPPPSPPYSDLIQDKGGLSTAKLVDQAAPIELLNQGACKVVNTGTMTVSRDKMVAVLLPHISSTCGKGEGATARTWLQTTGLWDWHWSWSIMHWRLYHPIPWSTDPLLLSEFRTICWASAFWNGLDVLESDLWGTLPPLG